MSRRCCDGSCNQGRDCPLRTESTPTRRAVTWVAGVLFWVAATVSAIVGGLPG